MPKNGFFDPFFQNFGAENLAKTGFFLLLWESSENQSDRPKKNKGRQSFRKFFENPPPLEKILDPPLVIGVIVFLCRDIHMPEKVKEAMQLMVAAERKKRAAITESEGKRASEINVAEGVKQVHF